MRDKEFLKWLYDRLVNVYKVDPDYDFMLKFKRVKQGDKKFLKYVYNILINVFNVDEHYDFMLKFNSIIES